MIYLVDANVLSEPTKQAAGSRVVAWLNANESNLIVDSIIIGELRIGIPLFVSSQRVRGMLVVKPLSLIVGSTYY